LPGWGCAVRLEEEVKGRVFQPSRFEARDGRSVRERRRLVPLIAAAALGGTSTDAEQKKELATNRAVHCLGKLWRRR
jgi:hypothetical protein